MIASILSIGDELILGETKDSNGPFLSEELTRLGVKVRRVSMVGDDRDFIEDELRRCIEDSQIVITTGGLGPTEDDLTRFAVSSVLKKPLKLNEKILEDIESFLRKRGIEPTENNRLQALFPEGSDIVENPEGTAPGFVVEDENLLLASLPGVPSEMKPMWDEVKKRIELRFNLEAVDEKIIHVCGLSEGRLSERIGNLWNEENVKVGTNVGKMGIKVRITGKPERVKDVANRIKERLGDSFVGEGEDNLRKVLERLLEASESKVEIKEDLHTSGLIAHTIESIRPGTLSKAEVVGTGCAPTVFIQSKLEGSKIALTVDVGKGPKKRLYPSTKGPLFLYVTFVLDSLRRDLLKLQKGDDPYEGTTKKH